MDRRTFVRDSGGAVAALWAAGAMRPALARAHPRVTAMSDCSRALIAVFDPSLVQGRSLARVAARLAVPALALEADADPGALWHARIVPSIAPHAMPRATLAVALRPSNVFVLERFAAAHGADLIDVTRDLT
ncbi:MAG TPA: hypothetical protein VGG24_04755 [Paraburkholderia sp.]